MKWIDNPAVQWSALDIEAHIDPIIESDEELFTNYSNMKDTKVLENCFHGLIEEVFEVYEDEIVTFINHKVQDYLYYNQDDIIKEIKSLIKK